MRILLFWIGGNHLYTDLYVNSKFIFCQELLIILNLSWILCYCFYLWWSFLNSYVLLSIYLLICLSWHIWLICTGMPILWNMWSGLKSQHMYHSDYKILVHLLRNLVCCHANQFVTMSFKVTPCNLYYCFCFTFEHLPS